MQFCYFASSYKFRYFLDSALLSVIDRIEKNSFYVNALVLIIGVPVIAFFIWSAFWKIILTGESSIEDVSHGNIGNSITPTEIASGFNPFVKEEEKEQIKESRLKLKLWGVLKLDDGFSKAFVSQDGSGKTGAFKKDDILPGGATLESIEGSYIVINNKGSKERLDVRKHDKSLIENIAPGKNSLRSLTRSIADIGFIPVFEKLEIVGFQVNARGNHELVESFGFKDKDILVSVNGRLITEYQSMYEVSDVMKGSIANIRVKRNGNIKNIEVKLD